MNQKQNWNANEVYGCYIPCFEKKCMTANLVLISLKSHKERGICVFQSGSGWW